MNGPQYVIAVSESLDFHMDTVFLFLNMMSLWSN